MPSLDWGAMGDESDEDLPELVNSSSSEDESDDDAPTKNLAGASSEAVATAGAC